MPPCRRCELGSRTHRGAAGSSGVITVGAIGPVELENDSTPGREIEREWIACRGREGKVRTTRSVRTGGRPMADTRPRYPFDWPSAVDQPTEFRDVHACPAMPIELPSGDSAWLVTGYHDVRALLTDPRVSKNRNRPDMARMVPATGAPVKHFGAQVEMDPPGHPRMRRLIAKA